MRGCETEAIGWESVRLGRYCGRARDWGDRVAGCETGAIRCETGAIGGQCETGGRVRDWGDRVAGCETESIGCETVAIGWESARRAIGWEGAGLGHGTKLSSEGETVLNSPIESGACALLCLSVNHCLNYHYA